MNGKKVKSLRRLWSNDISTRTITGETKSGYLLKYRSFRAFKRAYTRGQLEV